VPQANDSLVVHGLEMIVESMERNRVLWVKVRVSTNNNLAERK
jgi:CBS domain containing-hemolysin-like protein